MRAYLHTHANTHTCASIIHLPIRLSVMCLSPTYIYLSSCLLLIMPVCLSMYISVIYHVFIIYLYLHLCHLYLSVCLPTAYHLPIAYFYLYPYHLYLYLYLLGLSGRNSTIVIIIRMVT